MHTLKKDGNVKASVKSDKLSVDLIFDAQTQPYLLEWKYTACGDYVLGVEPTTAKIPQKNFTTIGPFETKTHGVKYIFRENK